MGSVRMSGYNSAGIITHETIGRGIFRKCPDTLIWTPLCQGSFRSILADGRLRSYLRICIIIIIRLRIHRYYNTYGHRVRTYNYERIYNRTRQYLGD